MRLPGRADGRAPATRGVWRVLRGTAVGSTATGLALAAHVLAGGMAPPAVRLTVVWLAVCAASAGLSRFRWTGTSLVALLLLTQLLLHPVFGWATPVGHAAHAHPVGPAIGSAMDLVPVAWTMLAGHAVAAVVTAALLSRGELWLADVLDALSLRVLRLLGADAHVAPIRRHAVVLTEAREPLHAVRGEAWSPRGPPEE